MSTRITPTFLLKGIDPFEVLREYQAGLYSRPIQKKCQIKITNNTTILAPTYGNNNNHPIFCMKDRNNSSIIIATTNHQNYEVFTKNGGQVPEGGRCDFCKEDFPHASVGYPVAYKELTLLTNDSGDTNDAKYRIVYVFWVEGCHCSFECALGYVRLFMNRPANNRDNSMADCERYLRLLYKLTYPQSGNLRAAQDPRLLKNFNKGSLTKEEWSDSRHVYTRSDKVLMIPAKIEYIRSNFETTQLTSAVDFLPQNGYTAVIPTQ